MLCKSVPDLPMLGLGGTCENQNRKGGRRPDDFSYLDYNSLDTKHDYFISPAPDLGILQKINVGLFIKMMAVRLFLLKRN